MYTSGLSVSPNYMRQSCLLENLSNMVIMRQTNYLLVKVSLLILLEIGMLFSLLIVMCIPLHDFATVIPQGLDAHEGGGKRISVVFSYLVLLHAGLTLPAYLDRRKEISHYRYLK